jgi:coatomer subunit delta
MFLVHVQCRSGGQTPVIGRIDGDYQFDNRKTTLIWSLPVIDQSNSEGSLEFSMKGRSADFFPIHVDFVAETPFCDIKVERRQTTLYTEHVIYL